MSSFDEKFLAIFSGLSVQTQVQAPVIWDKISNSETFKEKLNATSELGVCLCESLFNWKDEVKLLVEESISIPNFKHVLESFAQATTLSVLEKDTKELISILGLDKSEIEVAVAIRSFLVKDHTTELFLTTDYSKMLLQSLSLFPFFCMNRTEFHELLRSSTRLDGFAGFWNNHGVPIDIEPENDEMITFITKSKYFMLSFIEVNKVEEDLSSGHPDFLKVVAQMRLILSQLTRASVVKEIFNFHNSICCHAILTTKERAIVLTMKPFLYRMTVQDVDVIYSDYNLYLSGVYNLKSIKERIDLCDFLMTSASMALQITKCVCSYLVEQQNKRSVKSTILSPKKGLFKTCLTPGDIIYSTNHGSALKGFAIQIQEELENTRDKPMYEGTILNTNLKCIVKIYNNVDCNNYHTELSLNSQGFYINRKRVTFSQSDVTLKGIPLPDYIKNYTHDKKLLMIQLLVQVYFIHMRSLIFPGRIHNDIKPDNIVVYNDYPYFIDFETSKTFDNYDTENEQCFDSGRVLKSSSGTSLYNPPEKGSKSKGITPKSDIYSLGLVFIEILSPKTTLGRLQCLKNGNDPILLDLITKMTQKEIKNRPLSEDCLKHLGIIESEYDRYAPKPIPKDFEISPKDYEQVLKKRKTESLDVTPINKKRRNELD